MMVRLCTATPLHFLFSILTVRASYLIVIIGRLARKIKITADRQCVSPYYLLRMFVASKPQSRIICASLPPYIHHTPYTYRFIYPLGYVLTWNMECGMWMEALPVDRLVGWVGPLVESSKIIIQRQFGH